MKSRLTPWLEFLAFAVLTGCAAFTMPQTLDQRVSSAYMLHTAVVDAAASSLAAGDISSEQAQDVLDLARRTRAVLDGARFAMNAGDVRTAEGQLELAAAVLSELMAYLRARP